MLKIQGLKCLNCGNDGKKDKEKPIVKFGHDYKGNQRFFCKSCNTSFRMPPSKKEQKPKTLIHPST